MALIFGRAGAQTAPAFGNAAKDRQPAPQWHSMPNYCVSRQTLAKPSRRIQMDGRVRDGICIHFRNQESFNAEINAPFPEFCSESRSALVLRPKLPLPVLTGSDRISRLWKLPPNGTHFGGFGFGYIQTWGVRVGLTSDSRLHPDPDNAG